MDLAHRCPGSEVRSPWDPLPPGAHFLQRGDQSRRFRPFPRGFPRDFALIPLGSQKFAQRNSWSRGGGVCGLGFRDGFFSGRAGYAGTGRARRPNMYLEGMVVKVTRESIHLVVLGFAAAVITEEDIRDEFKFKVKHGQEIFRSISNRRHVIKVGNMIRFIVKSFNEEVLHISGSLAPANTGSIQWLDRSLEEAFSVNRCSKKRNESEGKRETGDLVSDLVDNEALSVDSHVIKKAKRRKGEEAY